MTRHRWEIGEGTEDLSCSQVVGDQTHQPPGVIVLLDDRAEHLKLASGWSKPQGCRSPIVEGGE